MVKSQMHERSASVGEKRSPDYAVGAPLIPGGGRTNRTVVCSRISFTTQRRGAGASSSGQSRTTLGENPTCVSWKSFAVRPPLWRWSRVRYGTSLQCYFRTAPHRSYTDIVQGPVVLLEFSGTEVEVTIRRLKSRNKAPGSDGIPSRDRFVHGI